MKAKKNLLFTFDYELFLGVKSGSVGKCMLDPTNRLLDLFSKHSVKHAIFFVDTTYLIRLQAEKSPACKKDFNLIADQLVNIVEGGHYVFPHIHPHWLDATYDAVSNQWSLADYSKYRFHNISQEMREDLFDQSVQMLHKVLSKSSVPFSINGYRAGGWSIQPFSDFKPLFIKHGIEHEFSVLKGFKNLSEAQYFNFENCPEKSFYKFEHDPCEMLQTGRFTEYVISSLKVSGRLHWLAKLWGKYLWKTGQRSVGDGTSLSIKDDTMRENTKSNKAASKREMISVELLTWVKLPYYKRFLKSEDYMQFISHPKMLSLHNLKCFENFIRYAARNFDIQTNFSQF